VPAPSASHKSNADAELMDDVIATVCLFSENVLLSIASAYILSALELLGLWCSVAVALRKPTALFQLLHKFGLRHRPYPLTLVLLKGQALYMVIITYAFTIYYFGAVYFLISRVFPDSFIGLSQPSKVEWLLTSLYLSGATITTLGHADIYPHAAISRSVVLLEVFIGLAFGLFIFAAFVSFHINRIAQDDN
jgi:hypothetical protein